MYTLHQHVEYSQWANAKIAEVLHSVSDDIFYKPVPSSFPSLSKTVLHIWDAEIVWLTRLKGISISKWPSDGYEQKKTELLNAFTQSGKDLLTFVDAQGPDFLTTRIKYKSMKGIAFEDPVEEILFHLVNHGTYHRGQLITMLHGHGVTSLPATDLVHFMRNRKAEMK